MARVSIYVSDDLKARMDDSGDTINWSEVARAAFLEALARNAYKRDLNMEHAIERLRVSRERYQQTAEGRAKDTARKWAATTASYEQLLRISELCEGPPASTSLRAAYTERLMPSAVPLTRMIPKTAGVICLERRNPMTAGQRPSLKVHRSSSRRSASTSTTSRRRHRRRPHAGTAMIFPSSEPKDRRHGPFIRSGRGRVVEEPGSARMNCLPGSNFHQIE